MVTLDRYRESRAWWNGEGYCETHVYTDDQGIRRTTERVIDPLGKELCDARGERVYTEDHTVDLDLRVHKVRDEKVARACGLVQAPRLPRARTPKVGIPYVGLHALSGYAFGRSSMLAEEIPALAAASGLSGVLLADPFALTGAVEFVQVAEQVGIQPFIGSTIELPEGGEIVLVAKTQAGYTSLSRLITECHVHEPRLFPLATWERLRTHACDLLCLTGGSTSLLNYHLARNNLSAAHEHLLCLITLYGTENVLVEVERSYLPKEARVNRLLLELADHLKLTPVAGGLITHAKRAHFPVQDMLAAIHNLATIDGVDERKPRRHEDQPQGRIIPARALNAERFLKSAEEMATLYADERRLVEQTNILFDRCEKRVLPERTKLPKIADDEAATLTGLVHAATDRLGHHDTRLRRRIERELKRIIDLGFAGHFLLAADMCAKARELGIHFSARGSVVDSVTAYYLGFSRINAFEHGLHFDRFLPADGSKRPDIDIDFEAARREDVRQYLVQKYGSAHVATVSAIGTFRTRGIVREIGKVMELPPESVAYLAKRIHGGVSAKHLEAAMDARPELRDSNIARDRFRWVFRLAERMTDIPRHMGAHSSGVVISADPIADTVPLMQSGADGVQIIQWDKRSSKRFFDKFDILCLRGQDVLSETEEAIRLSDAEFCITDVPLDDEATYRAMRAGQLIGIPQSASPAMRQAHIRIQTQNLTDASLVQAGIRPGVGGAVKMNELIARRRGKPFTFDHPDLREILEHTYGIMVFQEQVDQLLQVFGGYSSGEAEDIRESIYKKRREDFATGIRLEVLKRIVENGYAQAVAESVYDLVSGFNGYGFAQGHALAFAEISIRCIYAQQNFPAPYFTALLNAQPAGYYGSATIANEARIRGVKILRPDIAKSELPFSVEAVRATNPPLLVHDGAIRVGFNQLAGISTTTARRIVAERVQEPFRGFFDAVSRIRPDRDELEQLILCGAFDSLHRNRRALLWSIPEAMEYLRTAGSITAATLPLRFAEPALTVDVADFSEKEKAVYDRRIMGLDVNVHLMSYERERVLARGGISSREASELTPGTRAFVVGNPIRLRFPPTKSGKRVVFFDLEDETGLLNVTCFDDTYIRDGHAIVCSPYVTVVGEAQDRDGHIAFLTHRVFAYMPSLRDSLPISTPLPLKQADFLVG